MRKLQAALTDEPRTIHRLAEDVFGADGRAQVESTRRAAKRLAGQGRARLDYIKRDGEAGLWSDVIAERGYEQDARPAHPVWQLAARSAETKEEDP